MKQSTEVVRLIGRACAVGVAGVFLAFVSLQFVRIAGQNIALGTTLRDIESDVHLLQAKRTVQRHTIVRLSDPHGAIPEIHERLHLVTDREAIIYFKHTHAL